MDNIQVLLKQQADLAKKISDAYGAEERRKQNFAEFKTEIQKKKARADKFAAILGKMQDDKVEMPLVDNGWVKAPNSDPKATASTWTKTGRSIKIKIENGMWTTINGSEISEPQPLSTLPAYVKPKGIAPGPDPKTQPDVKI